MGIPVESPVQPRCHLTDERLAQANKSGAVIAIIAIIERRSPFLRSASSSLFESAIPIVV